MKVSRKGIKRHVKLTKTVLPAGRRGRNKRGTCLHKTTHHIKRKPLKGIQTGYAPTTRFLEVDELIELMEQGDYV
jgi:hypothetical protein